MKKTTVLAFLFGCSSGVFTAHLTLKPAANNKPTARDPENNRCPKTPLHCTTQQATAESERTITTKTLLEADVPRFIVPSSFTETPPIDTNHARETPASTPPLPTGQSVVEGVTAYRNNFFLQAGIAGDQRSKIESAIEDMNNKITEQTNSILARIESEPDKVRPRDFLDYVAQVFKTYQEYDDIVNSSLDSKQRDISSSVFDISTQVRPEIFAKFETVFGNTGHHPQ